MEVFSNTGTIHVLSVSGFHVSTMYFLITLLLKPIDRLKNGRQYRILFIFCFIWFYALICGFVPAVLRATVMFSLFLIGYLRSRIIFSLNTLFASAFLLLVYDPFILFDIGFQLSYLAVAGILVFVPLFQKLYQPKNKFLYNSMNLIYVSFAAQLTTTALAMYYFHQFPTYFMISNLLISIPSTLIIYLGSILAVFNFPLTNEWTGFFLKEIILITYNTLKLIDSLPLSTLRGLPFSGFLTLLSYIAIFLLFLSYRFRNRGFMFISLVLFCCVGGILLKKRLEFKNFEGLKIYNTRKELTIAFIQKGSVQLFSTCDSIKHKTLTYAVIPDLERYSERNKIGFESLEFENESQHISNGIGVNISILNTNNLTLNNSDLLILRNNSNVPDNVKASLTIFDGSNSWKHIQESMVRLKAQNRSYYILKDNFAYVWDSRESWKRQVYPF